MSRCANDPEGDVYDQNSGSRDRRAGAEEASQYYQPPWVCKGRTAHDVGANFEAPYGSAASYVDKILKGRKPADLPVEQPIKFEFIVNLKTAKEIGVTIELNVLVRANRVIR